MINTMLNMRSIQSLFFLFLLSFFIQSCASTQPEKTGIERSSIVIEDLKQVHEKVLNTSTEVDEVETTLSEVIRNGHPDIQRAFKAFSEDVNQLDKLVNQLYSNSNDLKKSSGAYLSSWQGDEKNYDSARLQEISEERHSELESAFDEIQNARTDSEQEIRSFVASVKDIRNFLENDLTSAGVESVTDLARDVLQQSDEIKDQLTEIEYAVEDALSEMARSGN